MKQRFFSVKLYVEGIRQLKVVGVIFLIIATLVNCILPLIELLVKAGVFEMESPTTEASALDMSQFTFILVVLAAIIMTFNLFKFLNKRSGSDFYHSLPVTRPCLFFSLCASVLTVVVFVFAIPILLAGLLYVIAGVKFLWDISALCLLSYALCALLLMACTLFGMSLTGTFISGFMMGLIVFLLPRILIMVYTSLLNNLTVIADVQTLNIFTYPAYNLPVNLCLSFFSITSMSWAEAICFLPGMLYTAVLGFVYLAVACLLFTFRKSETAEQSAPNRILQHIYRCIVALPISLTLPAIIVPAIVEGRAAFSSEALLMLLITLAAYLLYELITTKKLRNLLPALPVFLVVLGIDAIIGGSLLLSRTALLKQQPAADEIRSVVFLPEGIDAYGMDSSYFEIAAQKVEHEDETIRSAVSDALKTDAAQVLDNTYYTSPENNYTSRFNVRIRTTSGKTLNRTLRIDYRLYENEIIPQILQNDAFNELATSLPPEDTVTSVRFNREEIDPALWESFQKEFDALTDEQKYALVTNSNMYTQMATQSVTFGSVEINGRVGMREYTSSFPLDNVAFPETVSMLTTKTYEENADRIFRLLDLIHDGTASDFDLYIESLTDDMGSVNVYQYVDDTYSEGNAEIYGNILEKLNRDHILAPDSEVIYRIVINNIGAKEQEDWDQIQAVLNEFDVYTDQEMWFKPSPELIELLYQFRYDATM